MIRNATTNDIEQIMLVKPELDGEIIKNRLSKQDKGEVKFLVVEINLHVVSFVLLKWNGKSTHPEYPDIEDLYTKSDQRGMGYGSLLMGECEELAKSKGFSKIGLAVNPNENYSAYKLYEKLEYKTTGEKPYVDGIYNGVEDWCIDMVKNL